MRCGTVLLVCCCAWLGVAFASGEAVRLLPGQHRRREALGLGAEPRAYVLEGLRPGWAYEIRVSHPAWIPAVLHFQLAGEAASAGRRGGRRLLDCDKITFRVSPDGSVQGHAKPVLLLSASASGIHRDGPGGGATTLLYNIVLQPLLLGVIPLDTLPVLLTCVLLLLAVYLLLPVWTTRVAPALLDFIITRGAPQPARQHAPPYPTHPLGSAAKQLKD